MNFKVLGLKKLISTHYDKNEPTYKMEYMGGDDNDIEVGVKTPLEGNGDFRNQECLDLLDEADIVVTNPPFSLFREYVAVLMEHEKKFLIIGNKNNVNDKDIFPLLRDNNVWFGYCSPSEFNTPQGMTKKVQGLCRWFTNLDIDKQHERLILWKKYSPTEYPKYINYNAIEVNKVADIPCDYDGDMGVPITFIDSYNPEQFEIIGLADGNLGKEMGVVCEEDIFQKYYAMNKALRRGKVFYLDENDYPKKPYGRLIIRKK